MKLKAVIEVEYRIEDDVDVEITIQDDKEYLADVMKENCLDREQKVSINITPLAS